MVMKFLLMVLVTSALCMYKTMVLPALDYVDYIWDCDNKGESQELQYIQNKYLRVAYKVKLGKNPLYTTNAMHEMSKCSWTGE